MTGTEDMLLASNYCGEQARPPDSQGRAEGSGTGVRARRPRSGGGRPGRARVCPVCRIAGWQCARYVGFPQGR
ncbi:hypothetical protein GCM10027570_15040 [Streptomonospora sediminis]